MSDIFDDPYTYGKRAKLKRNLEKMHKGHHGRIPHVTVQGIEKKSCCKCGSLKTLDSFSVDKCSWDELSHMCKDCHKAKRKET